MGTILETRGLTKSFDAVHAVEDVSLAFEENEVVGIVGTNGSGKTTFINLVTGYLTPSAGRVLYMGEDITGTPPRMVTRAGIARSFQIAQLFTGLTVEKNLLLSVASRDGASTNFVRPLMNKAWLEEVGQVLSQFGLTQVARDEASKLPEGSRKLLDVAMSYLLRPKILFMDEPTAGVSVDDKFQVMDTLMPVLKEGGMTALFVEHDIDIIKRYSERTLAFDNGRVISDGPVGEVLADPAVSEAILGL